MNARQRRKAKRAWMRTRPAGPEPAWHETVHLVSFRNDWARACSPLIPRHRSIELNGHRDRVTCHQCIQLIKNAYNRKPDDPRVPYPWPDDWERVAAAVFERVQLKRELIAQGLIGFRTRFQERLWEGDRG